MLIAQDDVSCELLGVSALDDVLHVIRLLLSVLLSAAIENSPQSDK